MICWRATYMQIINHQLECSADISVWMVVILSEYLL